MSLKDIGPQKIQVIKAMRTFRADLALKEAKKLVNSRFVPAGARSGETR